MAFCTKCGTTIPEDSTDKFCPTCGQPIPGKEAPTTEAPTTEAEKKETSVNTDELLEKGKEVAGEALEKGKEVAGEALEKGKELVGNVVEQAKNIDVNEVVEQAKAGNKKVLGGLAVAAIAVVVVIALVFSLFGGGGQMSPIDDYIKAVNKQETDAKKIMQVVYGDKATNAAFKVIEDIMEFDVADIDLDDINEAYEDSYDDVLDEFDDFKLSFEKKSEKKLDKDDLEDIQDEIRDLYEDTYDEVKDTLEDEDDLEDAADVLDIDEKDMKAFAKDMLELMKFYAEVEITDGYEIKGKFIVKAEGDEYETETVKITVLKMNGEWVYYTSDERIRIDCDYDDDEYVLNYLFSGFSSNPASMMNYMY